MKEFSLRSGMRTLAGVFYPTGHAVVMFPREEHAQQTARALVAEGFSADEVELLTPDAVLNEILSPEHHEGGRLPSVGTEAATAHTFGELAHKGHHGLLIVIDDAVAAEHLMVVVRRLPFSAAQRYRQWVIEDLS